MENNIEQNSQTGNCNDLLIKDNPADMILLITVTDFDGTEKKVSLLFDSSDDWRNLTKKENPISVLGFFGFGFLKCLEQDSMVKMFSIQVSQVVNGKQGEFLVLRPYIRDGKRFRQATVKMDGTVDFE